MEVRSIDREEIKTKISSIGALGATQHLSQKMHHQILPISKVFLASNDRPVDGNLVHSHLVFFSPIKLSDGQRKNYIYWTRL